jgi:hypothetical protein
LTEEKLPVSETMKVVEAITIFKSDKWWAAVALVESFGRKQLAVYLWNKKDERWKRRQKFVIRNKAQWLQYKEAIEKLLSYLP